MLMSGGNKDGVMRCFVLLFFFTAIVTEATAASAFDSDNLEPNIFIAVAILFCSYTVSTIIICSVLIYRRCRHPLTPQQHRSATAKKQKAKKDAAEKAADSSSSTSAAGAAKADIQPSKGQPKVICTFEQKPKLLIAPMNASICQDVHDAIEMLAARSVSIDNTCKKHEFSGKVVTYRRKEEWQLGKAAKAAVPDRVAVDSGTTLLDRLIANGPQEYKAFVPTELLPAIDWCSSVLLQQSSVIDVQSPCTVFGRVNGQLFDGLRFLEARGWAVTFEKAIFLGGYADFGPHCIEWLMLLVLLKTKLPERIVLLRSSCSDDENERNGLALALQSRFPEHTLGDERPDSVVLYKAIDRLFAAMPFCALVNGKALCVSGHLSDQLQSLEDLRRIERPVADSELKHDSIAYDCVWLRPKQMMHRHHDRCKTRGTFVVKPEEEEPWYELKLGAILPRLAVTHVIDSRFIPDDGFQQGLQGMFITLCSAPGYQKTPAADATDCRFNYGACYYIDRDGVGSITRIDLLVDYRTLRDQGRRDFARPTGGGKKEPKAEKVRHTQRTVDTDKSLCETMSSDIQLDAPWDSTRTAMSKGQSGKSEKCPEPVKDDDAWKKLHAELPEADFDEESNDDGSW